MSAERKMCTRCQTVKAPADFNKRARAYDGLRPECRDCQRGHTTDWRERNADRKRAANEEWRARNPDRHAAHSRKWSARNPARVSAKQRRDTAARFEVPESVVLELRASPCGICGALAEADETAHAIDHCHATGAVRGALCRSCNTGIGHLRDSPELLARAIHYLTRGADYRAVDREA